MKQVEIVKNILLHERNWIISPQLTNKRLGYFKFLRQRSTMFTFLRRLQQFQMLYIDNNTYLGFNWYLAFQQLEQHYQNLTSDYYKAVSQGSQLQSKISNIIKQNQEIRSRKIPVEFQTMNKPIISTMPTILQDQAQITTKRTKKLKRRCLRKRRCYTKPQFSINQTNPYICTYQGCRREYKSSVSMNLHLKIKHNGGTKKERQEYAKIVIDALERGEVPPNVPIEFPPNFLEEFRTNYEYMKKYCM